MKVDVRLCGAIPRSEWADPSSARLTSSVPSYLAATNALANAPTAIGSKNDRSTSPITADRNSHDHCSSHQQSGCQHSHNSLQIPLLPQHLDQHNNESTSSSTLDTNSTTIMPLLEPPSWAVPASGEARLEPVCEALGKHTPVDLTTRSFYRVGRSPASDIQLLHGTSSRRHAMVFHHPNGSCYIVDCGSAHGTFVNGHRIITKTTDGWVVPHKVRRGSLIRFGGPGAPAFVLKSFAIGFSAMVSLDEEDGDEVPIVTKKPNSKWLVQVNTRLNALGRSVTNGALTETSANVMKQTKRSAPPQSYCSTNDDQNDSVVLEPCSKRRCMSPPLSPEIPIRLVSPDANASSTSLLIKPLQQRLPMTKRVHFQEAVQPFYPALVSPEDLSDNEESIPSLTSCSSL